MDRAEATGLGIATVGHVALLAAITFLAATQLPAPKTVPIEVSFVEEAGLESASPAPAAAEPAALLAPEEGPPEAAMPAPPEVQPVPQPQPQQAVPTPAPRPAPAPKPAPKAVQPRPAPARPAAKPAQAKPKPAPARPAATAKPTATRTTGRLDGLLNGVSERKTASRSTAAPAAVTGPVQASLAAEIRRQIKPHWRSPTGADAEQLRTEVLISLAPDGKVTDIRIVGTTGQTASNRPQVPLHREHAERAVRLASPFKLPAQYYDAWKSLRFNFDKRLSQ